MFKSGWILSGLTALGAFAGSAMAQDVKPMPAPAATTAPVMIGGCDSGCCTSPCTTGCFNSCDNGCERGGHVLFDLGFMILKPRFNDNPALFQTDGGTGSTSIQRDFSFSEQFVPQISLGYVGAKGFGARIGWWGFSESATTFAQADPNSVLDIVAASPMQLQELQDRDIEAFQGEALHVLVAQAKLRMNVWDFEALQTLESGSWSGLVSGGIRYAHISEDYSAVVLSSVSNRFGAAPGPRQFIEAGHNFNGAGPTLGLEGRRVFGDSGLYLFGRARGSVLFGEAQQSGAIGNFVQSGDGPAGVFLNAFWSTDTVVPEGEAEIGIGFERRVRSAMAFFQVGLVGEIWGNVGNASMSSGIPNRTVDEERSSINRDGSMGLVGVSFNFGLTY